MFSQVWHTEETLPLALTLGLQTNMVEESLRVLQLDPPFSPDPMNSCYFDSPCLMYSQSSNTSWKFYNSLRNEFCYLDLPELKDAEILYSKDGWLLMSQINNGPLFFFNPLTRQKFQLPRTEEPFDSVCFTSPPTCSDCFVFGIFGSSHSDETEYGLIRFGDEEWKIELYDGFMYANCPPVFHNGLYYCLDDEWRSFRVYDPTTDGWTICVLKFDLSEMCWKKVESLGDKCLYVSPNGSFAEDCGEGSDKANKIYFNKFHGKNGVWYSLSSGMYHSNGGDFASKDAYGLTQVDYSTWIKST
ncbi:PREDICTED: F-box protein At3g56470-like [Erythranthe guttata]|uniref:F-box protein At3g56470-like n=1 Tax=Erythranthe guttata TaxID=4155 RepID=UPI00064DC009|nr:PREDICTED: F-box protein At3g56470-like [Erythranthe guttata]|eukprot:XP_012833308.1 PREDICTED: F-box protein At3g56470-like [Erythranthe guttata]